MSWDGPWEKDAREYYSSPGLFETCRRSVTFLFQTGEGTWCNFVQIIRINAKLVLRDVALIMQRSGIT
eukprot:11373932-Heterocapsa_arctica.AAC.1